MRHIREFAILFTLLFASTFGMTIAAQDALPVEIVPPGEEYAGATSAEWDARFWQWSFSIPADVNPGVHLDNGLCGIGQFGPVFFLPGVLGSIEFNAYEIRCDVAEGTALYLDITAAMCSTIDEEPYISRNEQELRDCANLFIAELTGAVVTINGIEVENPLQYHHVTPMFPINFGPGNIYEIDPVVALAMAEGYGMIMLPPAPGQYVIEVTTAWEGLEDVPPVRWVVNVVEPTVLHDDASTPAATPIN